MMLFWGAEKGGFSSAGVCAVPLHQQKGGGGLLVGQRGQAAPPTRPPGPSLGDMTTRTG